MELPDGNEWSGKTAVEWLEPELVSRVLVHAIQHLDTADESDIVYHLQVPTIHQFSWVVGSQFARIRKLNGFARIRPGFAMLHDIVRRLPRRMPRLRIDSQFALIRKLN